MPNSIQAQVPSQAQSDAEIAASLLMSVSQICHQNWQIAELIVDTWLKLEQIEWEEQKAIQTNPLFPPELRTLTAQPSHAIWSQANQLVPQNPSGIYPDTGGMHWFYYRLTQGGEAAKIGIEADTRESAIAGYQMMRLIELDPDLSADFIYAVRRVRLQEDYPQLGRCEGNGTFILRANRMSIPQMAVVAAHQVGHLVEGDSDSKAGAYAQAYRNRNRSTFAAWRQETGTDVEPRNIIREGMQLVRDHAPESYQDLKNYRVVPNDRTPDASPIDVATHLVFVGLQKRKQDQLAAAGRLVHLPLEQPDCISPRAINVNRPLSEQENQAFEIKEPPAEAQPINAVDGVLRFPTFAYGDSAHQPGYHWGYYVKDFPEGKVCIAIDADNRDSARKGYECLKLFAQDPICRQDLLDEGINRFRFRSPLLTSAGEEVGGYISSLYNQTLSVDAAMSLDDMRLVTAHELRHHMGHVRGADVEWEADIYKQEYAQRSGLKMWWQPQDRYTHRTIMTPPKRRRMAG